MKPLDGEGRGGEEAPGGGARFKKEVRVLPTGGDRGTRKERYRAKRKADSAEGKGCLYGVKCLEDPTYALVGKVKILHHSVCQKHVRRDEADMLKQTESTLRRAQAADSYDGSTLYRRVLGAAKEID
ncbi:hypothetical protein EC968_007921 [Mortierella alpina]|nr:hypothetical protein EC968_007921 [Mortierella alpina]